MCPQAHRLASALSFKETCPDCAGSCTCHYGELQFDNTQLSTISCSFDHRPRVVPQRGCGIYNPNEAAVKCDKLVDKKWEADSDRIKLGGHSYHSVDEICYCRGEII